MAGFLLTLPMLVGCDGNSSSESDRAEIRSYFLDNGDVLMLLLEERRQGDQVSTEATYSLTAQDGAMFEFPTMALNGQSLTNVVFDAGTITKTGGGVVTLTGPGWSLPPSSSYIPPVLVVTGGVPGSIVITNTWAAPVVSLPNINLGAVISVSPGNIGWTNGFVNFLGSFSTSSITIHGGSLINSNLYQPLQPALPTANEP